MSNVITYQRFWMRRDTASNWASANPTLAAGEWGVEIDDADQTVTRFKLGDGVTSWSSLSYKDSGSGTSTFFRRDDLTATGGETVISLDKEPSAFSLELYKNRQLMYLSEYSFSSTTCNLYSPASSGDVYSVIYAAQEQPGASTIYSTAELTKFNPLTLSPLGSLSGNDRILGASSSGTYANCKSLARVVGNVYFSASASRNGSANWGVGICDVTLGSTNANWAGSGNSAAIWQEGRVYQSGSATHNMTALPVSAQVQIAVVSSNRRYWIRVNGGAWVGGGNPETNTLPTGTLPGSGDIFICASIDSTGSPTGTIQLPSSAANVTGTVPVGFSTGLQA